MVAGYTIKLLLTNCSFHAENIRTLVVCTDLIPFGPYGPSILPCGAHGVWISQLVNKSIVGVSYIISEMKSYEVCEMNKM